MDDLVDLDLALTTSTTSTTTSTGRSTFDYLSAATTSTSRASSPNYLHPTTLTTPRPSSAASARALPLPTRPPASVPGRATSSSSSAGTRNGNANAIGKSSADDAFSSLFGESNSSTKQTASAGQTMAQRLGQERAGSKGLTAGSSSYSNIDAVSWSSLSPAHSRSASVTSPLVCAPTCVAEC